jgi:hypothetical protein
VLPLCSAAVFFDTLFAICDTLILEENSVSAPFCYRFSHSGSSEITCGEVKQKTEVGSQKTEQVRNLSSPDS